MNKSLKSILVYDNLASPPTYGDFLCVILLAKFLILTGYKIKFYIIDSELREDWNDLNQKEIDLFLEQQLLLAKGLLNFNSITIRRLKWQDLNNELIDSSKNILFKENIVNRHSIYNGCFNLLNKLLSDKSKIFLDKFLFNYNDFLKFNKIKKVMNPYVTIGCRYSEKWGKERNLTEEEFIQIYLALSKIFPNHKLLVVSDDIGCQYFSNIAIDNGFDILFSKEYSNSFLGDGTLILGSDFYYQLRGGGIGLFAIFSIIPYHITAPLIHESMWLDKKLTSFQNENQTYENKWN